MTSSKATEKSYGFEDIPHSIFLYHWTCAINESDHQLNHVDSDKDNNNFVSMEEAFTYAKSQTLTIANDNPFINETPQIDYVAGVLCDDLSFNRMPKTVDLYIRDNSDDRGIEPNPSSDPSLWSSPDLYIRRQDDGNTNTKHQYVYVEDPSLGEAEFYVYANIHNRGTKPYVPSQNREYIHFFATNTNGRIDYRKYNGTNIYGDEFGEQIAVPSINRTIAPGDSLLVKAHVNLYADLDNHPWTNNRLAISLLGIISPERYFSDFPDDEAVRIDTLLNIRRVSNNVAMRNERFLPINPGNNRIIDFSLLRVDSCEIILWASNENLLSSMSLQLPNQVRHYRVHNTNSASGLRPVFPDNTIPLDYVRCISNLNLSNLENPKINLQFDGTDLFNLNNIHNGDALTILQCNSTTGDVIAGMTYIVQIEDPDDFNQETNSPYITQISFNSENQIQMNFSEQVSDVSVFVSTVSNSLTSVEKNIIDATETIAIDIPADYNGILYVDLKKGGKTIDSKKIIK